MVAPVMVGVDGSPGGMRAVEFARVEAVLRHRPLLVLCAMSTPVVDVAVGTSPQFLETTQGQRTAAQRLVDSVAEQAAEQEPRLSATGEVADAAAVSAAIIDRSRDCDLVVVGSRGKGGFSDLLLGSTSAQVAVHAACPVVVVRPSAREPGPHAGKVVVGVDDSQRSQKVLAFGFEAASRHNVGLVAVHVFPRPAPVRTDAERVLADESRMIAEALAGWQKQYPDVDVTRIVSPGNPRRMLSELSAGASLMVMGSRGRGGFAGMVFGSTSLAVLHHASAPVAVVHY